MNDDGRWSLADVYADLTTLRQVAEALDVRMERVYRWVKRRDMTRCPYPVRKLPGGDLYSMVEWQDWFEYWKAKPRRKNSNPGFTVTGNEGGYIPFKTVKGSDPSA